MRGVGVALADGATGAGDEDVPAAVYGPDEAAVGMGASLDASSDGSIIGETQVPEYAESMGAFAHEPDEEVSDSIGGEEESSSAGGVALGAAGRDAVEASGFGEPVDSADAEAGVFVPLGSEVPEASAFRVPLDSADAEAGVFVPLGSDVPEASALRASLDSADAEAGDFVPLGSDTPEASAFRVPLDSVDAEAGDFVPLGSDVPEASAFRASLDSADTEAGDFVPLGSDVPEASAFRVPLDSADAEAGVLAPPESAANGSTGRVPLAESGALAPALVGARVAGDADGLAAVPGVLTDARVGGFAAVGLPVWLAEPGSTGGIPKPAGVAAFWASAGGAAFVGAAARTGAGAAGDLGGLAVAAGSEAPCAGFTSLAAESALEVFPFAGSSVDSNWSNPSRSSDSDS